MSKIVKTILLALILQTVCFSHAVIAGPVQSNTQFSLLIGVFIEKMEKIHQYKKEIDETKDMIKSLGTMGENAASELIKEGAEFKEGFQDFIHFNVETEGKRLYGIPHEHLSDAKKYVKDTFFYSVRKDDKRNGELLKGQDKARRVVSENRYEYYKEVIAFSYSQSLETSKKAFEKSKERWEFLMKKLESAETYDDKKAVEVAIVQNDIRERMIRLSLELSALELDVVTLLYREPEEYIITRSLDEIQEDVDEKLGNVK